MEKKTKTVLIVIIVVAVIVVGAFLFVISQGQDDTSKFIGTWELIADENYTITFHSNRTFDRGVDIWGTWEISEGKLVLYTTDNTSVEPVEFTAFYNYYFSDNDQTLTIMVISDGTVYGSMTFTKQ